MSRFVLAASFLAGVLATAAPVVATSPQEDRLADLYQQARDLFHHGKYAEAEKLFKRVLADNPRVFATTRNLPRALALSGLARVYLETGNFALAEAAFQEGLATFEAVLGKDHPEVGNQLAYFADLYRVTGRYDQAERLFRRSLAIYEAQPEKDRLGIAGIQNALAQILHFTGRYDQAIVLYRRSLALREAELGKDAPDVGITLNNLAAVYQDQKRYAEAEPLYRRCLAILEAHAPRNHPDLAKAMNNLAGILQDLGKFDQAEPLYKRSLDILLAARGENNPDVATALNRLADLNRATGRFAQAEPLYRRSLASYLAVLGPDHPDVAIAWTALASVSVVNGRPEVAARAFDRARRVLQQHAARILPILGEREQLDFLRRIDEPGLHLALSLALSRPADAGLVGRSAGWVLNAKGQAQRTQAQTLLAARDGRDPRLARDLQQQRDLRSQMARLTLQGAQPGQEATHKNQLADLVAKEQALTARLQRQGVGVEPRWIEPKEVQAVLPGDAVFIDLARIEVQDFAGGKPTPPRYAAWIARRDGTIRLVDLGSALVVDAALAQVRKALDEAPKVLKAQGEIAAEKISRAALARLARLVLAPLRQDIDGAKRWIISPDGALWLAPWAALPLDDKTFAVEKHTIQLVVSGRDLLPHPPVPGQTSAPAIFADPDFDAPVPTLPAELRGLSGELRLGSVPPLPSTASEADAIADKMARVFGLAPVVLTEGKATSAAFLALKRPRALTLATHGFFLPASVKASADPLLRCGLLLAGCNKPGVAGRAGVLTGREVLSADLRGCELVVLSACQTGLGDVRNGEGVAGLRQAFQLAGAESVLASLWQVPDDETTLQMVAFMDALAKGKDRVEAIAEAQRRRIAARREKFGAAHPFNWAAFTLTGSAESRR